MRIVYQSEDGKIFTTEEKCLKHENELLLAKHALMKNTIDQVSTELSIMIQQYAKAIRATAQVHYDSENKRIIPTFIQNR